jgi:hypothetical protein
VNEPTMSQVDPGVARVIEEHDVAPFQRPGTPTER